jgi:KaiC/GvpD/RAD55 family RecA-like ATPase
MYKKEKRCNDESDNGDESTTDKCKNSDQDMKIESTLTGIFKRFFDMEPTSLLIRGLPGTGKTTLALELVNMLHERHNCFYISTRVSFNKLQRYYPWIIGLLNDNSLLSYTDVNNSAIDLRLGSASGTMELALDIITNKKNTLMVLDSWDSLVNHTSIEERIKMEKTMITIADTHDALIIFVSEEPELNTTAYMVDGIVTLSAEYFNGARIRKMGIDKMRGIMIDKHTYLYTLQDSRFTVLQSSKSINRSLSSTYNNTDIVYEGSNNDDSRDTIHRWYNYLDDIMKNIHNSRSILVEIDPSIEEPMLLSILAGMMMKDTIQGHKILVGSSIDGMLSRVTDYTCMIQTNARGNILLENGKDIVVSDTDTLLSRYDEMNGMRRSSDSNSDGIFVVVDDSILSDREYTIKMINRVKSNNNNNNRMLMLSYMGVEDRLVKGLSDVHMGFYMVEDTPLLHIIKPSMGLFGVPDGLKHRYPLVKVV